MVREHGNTKKKSKPEDRRVKRTRHCFRNALISLLHDHKFTLITVQDIAEKADINRVTFYSHYQDKDDLLSDIMDTLLADMLQAMQAATKPNHDSYHAISLSLFTFVGEHFQMFQVLLHEEKVPVFWGKMFSALHQFFYEKISSSDHELTADDRDLYSHYFSSVFISVIQQWVTNRIKYMPVHLAAIMNDIMSKSPRKIIYKK